MALTAGNTSFSCAPEALAFPIISGAEILSIEASLVQNYTARVSGQLYYNHGDVNATNLSFCNNDTVLTQIWLPTETWNGRMQAVGGGGWVAGMFTLSYIAMAGAVGEGYAGVTTNAGLPSEDPKDWALLGPGNVDLYALQNLASVSLNDAAMIGESIIKSFYREPPKYSYWSGCSQGGRQGLMLAQRYPKAFDGIAASAPAINCIRLQCEMNALTVAVIDACDGNDGLIDGMISDPDSCQFDPYTIVGKATTCSDSGITLRITKAAAAVANAAWRTAKTANETFLWYGTGYEANLTTSTSVAHTECQANGTCISKPSTLFTDWMGLFIEKTPAFDTSSLTRQEYENIYRAGVREYSSIIGTNFHDLTGFRKAGGKMIAYHGLADETIPFRGTRDYYEAVAASDPSVHSYCRLFEAPGLGHCSGGVGVYPAGTFDSLVAWVESDEAPDTLEAASLADGNGVEKRRILCPYPRKALYDGVGDPNSSESFSCSRQIL
ncbi:feruloyl esteras-like protein B precursor [Botryosphaeria dothidea]|uniref:Carboxylic ester hydrolase n=1 Tax=Botryosphaeria dothidea TaxID=55169 RepID=A0A8H4N5P6_9PEZI|nr:feruloyl esteras-like protein B precursor [Botryosphaeria dothidea]